MVVLRLARSPHIEKVLGSIRRLGLDAFCVELACSTCGIHTGVSVSCYNPKSKLTLVVRYSYDNKNTWMLSNQLPTASKILSHSKMFKKLAVAFIQSQSKVKKQKKHILHGQNFQVEEEVGSK